MQHSLHSPRRPNAPSAHKRRVVDAFTRALHALLALSFGLAYVTSEVDALRIVHVTMGYTLGAVFVVRLLWGVVGPRRVRLWVLGSRLAGLRQLLDLVRRFDWQEVLQRLLVLSIVVLLVCVLPVIVTGYATYFGVLGNWTEDIHESLANAMLLAVGCHVAAVTILSVVRPGRLVRPMISGYTQGLGPDLVKHNLVPVALAMVMAVAGFWSWQTYQYLSDPQFTQPPRWLHPVGGYVERDDD